MSGGRDARVRLTRLLDEGKVEVDALRTIAEAVARDRDAAAAGSSEATCALAATRLHRYYTALEVLLERVARLVDDSVPEGPTSHRDLLQQMAMDMPPLRTALFDRVLVRRLHALLSFRHFFRHAYDVPLDVGELRRHVDNLIEIHPAVEAALAGFFAFIRATRDAMSAQEP